MSSIYIVALILLLFKNKLASAINKLRRHYYAILYLAYLLDTYKYCYIYIVVSYILNNVEEAIYYCIIFEILTLTHETFSTILLKFRRIIIRNSRKSLNVWKHLLFTYKHIFRSGKSLWNAKSQWYYGDHVYLFVIWYYSK